MSKALVGQVASLPHAWLPVLLAFGVAAIGSILHYSLGTDAGEWRHVLPGLYFIPIVIAGISLGGKAAVGVGLAAGAAHAIATAAGCGDPWSRPATETILFICVGLTAARLTRMHEGPAGAPRAKPGGADDESLTKAFRGAESSRQIPALGQIVAGLVRRFRTPVSSIEGAVGLLNDSRFPEEKRAEFVRIIHKESHQLDRALSDIQDFTQPGRPRVRKVDLPQLLDKVIQLAGPKDHEHFFLFQNDISPDVPPLHCDPDQIAKALLNLVMNSIQAMPWGGQIAFVARKEPRGIVISVRDRGRGILSHNLNKIFDPFFTTRESGLGLGLTVARQIATAHGGSITVDQSNDKGTTVSLVLPLTPGKPDELGPHTGG